jgi:hypothetical protein
MKLRAIVFGALLSLVIGPVVVLGRPVVASAGMADPMFQVQVPGVFKQKAFPVDATAGKSVPGVVTLADAESAIAGRGALSASAEGSLGSVTNPGVQASDLFIGGFGRAEFRLPDVTFSGPAPVGSTISAALSFDLSGSLGTSALHSFTSDAALISEASAGISGQIMEPTSFIGGSFGGQAKVVSKHLANATLTSSLNRDGVFGVESKTLPDASIAFIMPTGGGFTTDPLTVVIGKPMTLDVSLSVLGGTTWDGTLTGGDIASGAADFAHTLSFPSSGPVFVLPSGFTVNSPSGLIVNNQYVTGAAPQDSTPPTTTATLTSSPNGNGWNNTDLTVNLSAADNLGGSGVKEINATLAGAQTGGGVTAGSTTSITISQEGITTLTFFARDNAGNAEAPKTLTIRIDKTAPTIVGSSRPLTNAHGWNNTDVTVHFDCSDTLSGVASCASDTVLSSEGANQSVTGTASDVAGNAASTTVGPINIDKTPPVTRAGVSPPSNANGWNRTPIQVTLNASDDFSGVQSTEFNLDGAGLQPYAGPIAVSAEGVHHLDFRSTDHAGNVESIRSLVVNIDRTPPEALIRFDPATQDLAVVGRDSLSGVAEAALVSSVRNIRDDEDRPVADVRTYRVDDLAGNTLLLTERVEKQGSELQGMLLSLTYNGTAVPVQANESNYHWSLGSEEDDDRSESNRSNPRGFTVPAGTLTRLKQDLQLGEDDAQQSVEANYSARRGITVIRIEQAKREHRIVRQGLALLGLATDAGNVLIEF